MAIKKGPVKFYKLDPALFFIFANFTVYEKLQREVYSRLLKSVSRLNDSGKLISLKRCTADKTAVNVYL